MSGKGSVFRQDCKDLEWERDKAFHRTLLYEELAETSASKVEWEKNYAKYETYRKKWDDLEKTISMNCKKGMTKLR